MRQTTEEIFHLQYQADSVKCGARITQTPTATTRISGFRTKRFHKLKTSVATHLDIGLAAPGVSPYIVKSAGNTAISRCVHPRDLGSPIYIMLPRLIILGVGFALESTCSRDKSRHYLDVHYKTWTYVRIRMSTSCVKLKINHKCVCVMRYASSDKYRTICKSPTMIPYIRLRNALSRAAANACVSDIMNRPIRASSL